MYCISITVLMETMKNRVFIARHDEYRHIISIGSDLTDIDSEKFINNCKGCSFIHNKFSI